MTTPEPTPNTHIQCVPQCVPECVPERPRAHCETSASPVPSSSIGDALSEPSPPRPPTSSQDRDEQPHQHPTATTSNPMPERRVCEPHATESVEDLVAQRAAITANRNALALKLADARAEVAAMRERGDRWQHSWLDATANLGNVLAAASHPHKGPDDTDASMLLAAAARLEGGYEPGGSHTKQTVARVLRAVAVLLPEESAAGELHDQPHQQHDRSEAPQADGQDDEQLGALGLADQGVHGASVGAAPAASPVFADVDDPRFAGQWVNPPGSVPTDVPVATGFTSSEVTGLRSCLPSLGERCGNCHRCAPAPTPPTTVQADRDAGQVRLTDVLAAEFAQHDDEPGWTNDDNDMPVYECQCGDRSPALDHDYIGPEDVTAAATWHRLHMAAAVERILASRVDEAEAELSNVQADYDRRGERLWRLAMQAGHVPNDADNDASAELTISNALVTR